MREGKRSEYRRYSDYPVALRAAAVSWFALHQRALNLKFGGWASREGVVGFENVYGTLPETVREGERPREPWNSHGKVGSRDARPPANTSFETVSAARPYHSASVTEFLKPL